LRRAQSVQGHGGSRVSGSGQAKRACAPADRRRLGVHRDRARKRSNSATSSVRRCQRASSVYDLTRCDSIRLDSTRLDSTRLDSAALGSLRLDSTRIGRSAAPRLRATRLDSTIDGRLTDGVLFLSLSFSLSLSLSIPRYRGSHRSSLFIQTVAGR